MSLMLRLLPPSSPHRSSKLSMRQAVRFVAVVGALVIANRIVTLATSPKETPGRKPTPQLIRIERDLGEVWENEAYPCKLILHNTGDRAVEVSSISGECTCV